MGPAPATSEPTRPSASPRASRRRSRRPDVISASREALHGRPRQGVPSPYHARLLTKGLNKESDLRPARCLIPRIARDQLIHSPSPLPRPVFLTARHVSLILQPLPQSQPDDGSTPQNGRRDLRSHQCHTGWDRAWRGLPATLS